MHASTAAMGLTEWVWLNGSDLMPLAWAVSCAVVRAQGGRHAEKGDTRGKAIREVMGEGMGWQVCQAVARSCFVRRATRPLHTATTCLGQEACPRLHYRLLTLGQGKRQPGPRVPRPSPIPWPPDPMPRDYTQGAGHRVSRRWCRRGRGSRWRRAHDAHQSSTPCASTMLTRARPRSSMLTRARLRSSYATARSLPLAYLAACSTRRRGRQGSTVT